MTLQGFWYYQYFPESSSICNTGITSIFQNLPVSAILVLPVFPRIFRYLQYSYFGNDQYLLVLQILENSGRYWDTSIYQYLYQYCRYWKILVKYWYCSTSIAAGCFILSVLCLKVSIYQFCRKQLTKLANLLMHSQCALSEAISSSIFLTLHKRLWSNRTSNLITYKDIQTYIVTSPERN